jgi:Mrp family chromosome partitioning ATPase
MTDQFAGGPFEEITNDQYEAEHAAAKAAHVTPEDMPLNPEQRAAARNLLAYVNQHASSRDISDSETIATRARELGLSAVTLVLGPGGTGKSQVTKSITREIAKRGHGAVIVTAYTGVAATPFRGPTLLSLLNMKPKTKPEGLTDLEPTQLEKLREKFKKESGVDIQDVAAIIIDEISFVDTKILGHVSHALSQLFNKKHQDIQHPNPVCGAVPMFLCGDVHQLVGPGSKAWYKEL